ncbi:MAG: alpha/beta fold hydrolase [Myxococcales bacterium]|nr:alpha/beta fold hydrolase [Myxococcales bacterium]
MKRALLLLPLLAGCLSFHRGPMPGEPPGATFAEVNGVRLRYLDRGTGPVVVLLHGFASSLETWLGVIPELERHHRVIALDLMGFGWSDRPAGDYSPAAQAKLVLSLLDRLEVSEFDLTGHSWGCSVALALALSAPQRVHRLALYDAWVFSDQLPTFFHWSRAPGIGEILFSLFYNERPGEKLELAFFDPEAVPESLVEEVERALSRPGTRAAALQAVRGQRFEELEGRYSEVRQPVLLLWGREDAVSPVSVGERLQQILPDARLVVYPRAGHFPMIEAAAASNRELVRFFGRTP